MASTLPFTQLKDELEGFRQSVQALEILYAAQTISFTVSIGVASKTLASADDARSVLIKADENLYLAKHKGRNTIVT